MLAGRVALRPQRLGEPGQVLDLVEPRGDRLGGVHVVLQVGDREPAVALCAFQDGQRAGPVESRVDLDLVDAGVHQAVHLRPGLPRRTDDLGRAGPALARVAVEQRAGADEARRAGVRAVPGFAPCDRLIERAADVAHRRDAVGQVEGSLPVLGVHVDVDQPRQYGGAGHVHALDVRAGRQLR